MWWGRLLQGIWFGSSGLIKQAYVAEVLPKEENINIVNYLYYAYIGGMSVGPLAGLILINFNFSVSNNYLDCVDFWTNSGWKYINRILLNTLDNMSTNNVYSDIRRSTKTVQKNHNKQDDDSISH